MQDEDRHAQGSADGDAAGDERARPPTLPERSGDGRPFGSILRSPIFWALLVLVGLWAGSSLLEREAFETVPYSELKAAVAEGRFERVELRRDEVIAFPAGTARGDAPARGTPVSTATTEPGPAAGGRPWKARRVPGDDSLVEVLDASKTTYAFSGDSGVGAGLLIWLIPLGFAVLLWVFMMRRLGGESRGGTQGLLAFGKSNARVQLESDTGVTFDDVAGVPEAVEELHEVVEFLRHPEKYRRLGGKLPKGVLLVGPPGTGKTLIARAVAGEAGVPFFSLSGAEFVEMFVGVGAARVRDLFEKAQAKAPAIIFIDELDALGRARVGAPAAGANEEREQTLNQLLNEMDGFDPVAGLIVLAATNRPEVLDVALLRPGRFDRQVLVDRPDKLGRVAILRVHCRGVTLDPDVDLEALASTTSGFAGADLANLVNEAALLAARRGADAVQMGDLEQAVERVVAGLQRRSRRLNEQEKRIVAFHEAGHALVGLCLPHGQEVRKVSIIPRGIGALGYTISVPREDRYLLDETELRDQLAQLLAGRAAELLVFETSSTGAADDLERATDIARSMVTEFGMSEVVGPVGLGDRRRPRFLSREGTEVVGEPHYGEATAVAVDGEVKRLVTEALDRAAALLRAHRRTLDRLATHLLEHEVIDRDALLALAGPLPRPLSGAG